MKHLLFPIFAILLLASCTSDDQPQPTKSITFNVDNINTTFLKATLSAAYCTDLWVVEGTTLLKHQTSTDTDFGTPTIDLTYGTHNLTFIASASKEQSFANGLWTTTKVIDDYATQLSVTIDGTTATQQVSMNRRNSRITFITTDNVPTNVAKCHLYIQNNLSLNADLTATNEQYRDVTLDISAYQGKPYSVFVNVLTASPTDEEDCNVTIEFLDASNNVLYHYNRTVSLQANRNTNLTGEYFRGQANAITLNTEWLTAKDTNL